MAAQLKRVKELIVSSYKEGSVEESGLFELVKKEEVGDPDSLKDALGGESKFNILNKESMTLYME